MMTALESNQFTDVDFNSSSTDCSTSAAEHLTPRGDSRDEYNSEEEKPTPPMEKPQPSRHASEWRLEVTKKTTNQSVVIGSDEESVPITNVDTQPHVQCPIDDRHIESKRSPHSILDLFGLRSLYTQICRKFTLPVLYAYPKYTVDSSDSEEEEEEEEEQESESESDVDQL